MAELGLAGVATADPAIKSVIINVFRLLLSSRRYGKQLIQLCADFRHADEEKRTRMKTIRSAWIRTERQIDFLGRIWDTLDTELQEHQNELLDELASKLDAANKQISRVFRKIVEEDGETKVNRLKYAGIKGSIDKAIHQLREWQRDFDPGWFLIMRIAKPVIDRELAEASGLNLATSIQEDRNMTNTISMARNVRKYMNTDIEENFEMFRKHDPAAKLETITNSAARLVQRIGKAGARNYIVDTVSCLKGVEVNILIRDIRELARKLFVADPFTFGLLQCRGVSRSTVPRVESQQHSTSYSRFPQNSKTHEA